jgi:hypothetical protein
MEHTEKRAQNRLDTRIICLLFRQALSAHVYYKADEMSKRGLPLPDSDVFNTELVPGVKLLRAAKRKSADATSSVGSSESSCSSTDVNEGDASSDSDDRIIVVPNQGSPKKSCLKSATPPEKMITKHVNLLQSPGLHMDT